MTSSAGPPAPGPAYGDAEASETVDETRRRLWIEERDQLLRSLDQIDEEHRAGDLDDDDHRALSDGYTSRLAVILRRLDNETQPSSPAEPKKNRKTPAIVVIALLVFSLGAGFLLARASGERGVHDQITGSIDGSSRNRVAECQQLGSTDGDLLGALECFDELLAQDTANAEALSYRGWYLLLAAGALQENALTSDENDEAIELIASALTYFDRAIEADPNLPDPLAFRASVFDRLGQSDLVCADITALLALDPPEFFVNQTAALAARNGC